MDVYLNINGSFEVDFYYLNGKKVGEYDDKDILQGILDYLQTGEYIITMTDMEVFSIDDLYTPLYRFRVYSTDFVDYEWEGDEV